ncbi:MAG: DUF2809 domain-containing protein [Lachnospiraceae bacterium]|nr:DUF2809 domain-containing protein [Lachnospiraceae bacterium]
MKTTTTDSNELAFIRKMRLRHILLALLLFAEEVYIGVMVHDRFVRPYVGDLLVVVLLYFFVRIFFVKKPKYLSIWIFLFAVFVELTQIAPLADVLGIKNKLIRVLMGTSFAWGDILAYLMGSVINFVWDLRIKDKRRS